MLLIYIEMLSSPWNKLLEGHTLQSAEIPV